MLDGSEISSPEKGRVLHQSDRVQSSNWIVATSLAVGCGVVYLLLRPPLYDFDGYMFRLYALLPSRFSNSNPHHLLWNTVQILLTACAASLGEPNTVPFQIFGILVNCLTLFMTYWLLLAVGKSRVVAIAGVVFTAFSPAFWYVGLENHPYPLAFLAIVLYLTAWHREDGSPPEGLRLCVAGLSLALSILFHQGVIVLLPVATCVPAAYGRGTLWQKLTRAVAWKAGVAGLVAAAYVCFWQLEITSPKETIFSWAVEYLNTVHPVQLLQLGFRTTLARSMMGLSGMLVQDYRLRWLLSTSWSPGAIIALYDAIGLLVIGALIAAKYWALASGALWTLLQKECAVRAELVFTRRLVGVRVRMGTCNRPLLVAWLVSSAGLYRNAGPGTSCQRRFADGRRPAGQRLELLLQPCVRSKQRSQLSGSAHCVYPATDWRPRHLYCAR